MSQSLKKSSHPALLTPSEKKSFLEIISRFKRVKILVVGDFILDRFIWGTVDRISPEAPVPVVLVKDENYMPGGSLNVANNIHTLGGTVYPGGVVGRDLEGRALVKVMRGRGIDTGGVVYDAHRRTALKTRIVAHSQQVVRFDRESSEDVSRDTLKKIVRYVQNRLREADVMIVEDYGKGVIQPALLKEIVSLAKKMRKPVLVDPKEKNFSFYSGVTTVTPNRKEAFAAFLSLCHRKASSLEEAGKGLIKAWKADSLLMTLGEDGMALFEKNGAVTRIPTTAQEVYDVSGAGDTVIGVLAMALAAGAKMKDAAKIANVAAGVVVGKLGTATLTAQELRDAVENFTGGK